MIAKRRNIGGIIITLLFISLLVTAGFGGYFYYMRHREPTQGIFVYDQEMRSRGIRREALASGYLYQPT